LGLLKSTMLQLDPAFTERDYGVSSFSAFVDKLVEDGLLALRTVDGHSVVDRRGEPAQLKAEMVAVSGEDALPFLQEVLQGNTDLLTMGIPAREIRALVKAADPDFKETDYGFQEFTELLNFAADKGLLRIDSDPNQGLRFYPGPDLQQVFAQPARRVSSREEFGRPASGRPHDLSEESRGRSRGRRRRRRNGKPSEAASNGAAASGNVAKQAASGTAPSAQKAEPRQQDAEPPAEAAGNVEAKPRPKRKRTSRSGGGRSRKSATQSEPPSSDAELPEDY
jgi:hypothetical protein